MFLQFIDLIDYYDKYNNSNNNNNNSSNGYNYRYSANGTALITRQQKVVFAITEVTTMWQLSDV